MKETHNQKIVKTLKKGWFCYGKLIAENEYASSIPRSTAKLREKVDTSEKNIDIGLIGILKFDGKTYKWFEKIINQVKYFKLIEL